MKAYELGKNVDVAFCGAGRLLAGGAGDNTAVTGASIDTREYHDLKLVFTSQAVLAAEATFDVAIALQESANGSDWDTAEEVRADAVVSTGPGGGGTVNSVLTFDIVLRNPGESRKRYIRFNYTPDLSAANTDVAQATLVALLAGKRVKV